MRVENMKLSLVESAGLFPVWMIFYVMGVLKSQEIDLPFQNRHPLAYAMFAIVLCCIHILILYKYTGNVVHGIKFSAHIYLYFFIMWLFTDNSRKYYNKIQGLVLGRLIVSIGKFSFFIYLTHCLLLCTFSYLHIPEFWLFKWILCIGLSILMACVCDKMCPVKFKRYVGF